MPPRPVPSINRVNRYCRLCLKDDTWEMPLPICRSVIRSTIKEVLGIEVRISEKLPNAICHCCLSKLEFFYNFKKEVKKSLSFLKDFGLDATADIAQPVVQDAPRRTAGPKSRVTVNPNEIIEPEIEPDIEPEVEPEKEPEVEPEIEPSDEATVGPKNRGTKSCPSCEYKTGNPVDYKKHREDHQKESGKENSEKDNDSVPSESEDNEGNDENVEKETANPQLDPSSTYFPCTLCNMPLISSREKLLAHKIEKHGFKEGESSRGEEKNDEEGGEKRKEKDGNDRGEDGNNKERRDSQENGKNGKDSEENGRNSRNGKGSGENSKHRKASQENDMNSEIGKEDGRNSKNGKDSEDNARNRKNGKDSEDNARNSKNGKYIEDNARNSKNGKDSGGNGGKSEEKDENSRKEDKSTKENNYQTSRETGNKRSRSVAEVSSDSDDFRVQMPVLRAKKRLLTKRSSSKKLDRSELKDSGDTDSDTSDTSSDSSSVNVSRSRKRAKPPPLDSSSDEASSDADSDANENMPNLPMQKSEVDSKVAINPDQNPGDSKVGADQVQDPAESKNLGSDDEIMLLIDDHMKSLINDSKNIDNNCLENGAKDVKSEDRSQVDKTSPDNARKKVTNKKQELCDLCNKYFPSMSILASHKRRSHSSNTSKEKKAEGSSGVDKPEGVGKDDSSSRGSCDVKRLQDGGRIVKRSQNISNKRSTDGSVNKQQTDENSVKKLQDRDSSATVSNSTVKTPQTDNRSVKTQDRDSSATVSNSTVKTPQTDNRSVKTQDRDSSATVSNSTVKTSQTDNKSIKRPQNDDNSAKRPRKNSSDSNVKKPPDTTRRPEDNFRSQGSINSRTSQDVVKRQHDASSSVRKPLDGSASYLRRDGASKEIDLKLPCYSCDRRFATPSALENHKRDAHRDRSRTPNSIQNRVACNLCSEKFPSVGELYFHKYNAHKKVSMNR